MYTYIHTHTSARQDVIAAVGLNRSTHEMWLWPVLSDMLAPSLCLEVGSKVVLLPQSFEICVICYLDMFTDAIHPLHDS